MTIKVFENMIGKTFNSVSGSVNDGEMEFENDDEVHRFFHQQDCCESVYIQSIDGDLKDLVDAPILIAEEVSSEGYPDPDSEYLESFTWTFYKFATVKGHVTVRWLGESNGYYGEEVDYSLWKK